MNRRSTQGFTLIELMIVIAIIAIIAAIAIPNLLSARLSANESNAVSTLRNLVTSQAQFQSAASVDNNNNGTGEYGSLSEMSGLVALNLRGGAGGSATPLNPPILPATFQVLNGAGYATKSGYLFAIYLPTSAVPPIAGANDLAGLGGATGGGPPAGIDDGACEVLWCCYAWPVAFGNTGNRTFFVNQRGEILQTKCDVLVGAEYSGAAFIPAFDAAFTVAGDMSAPPAIGVPGIDTNTWTPLG